MLPRLCLIRNIQQAGVHRDPGVALALGKDKAKMVKARKSEAEIRRYQPGPVIFFPCLVAQKGAGKPAQSLPAGQSESIGFQSCAAGKDFDHGG